MSVLISNDTIKQIFHIAQSIARENYNSTYGASHLLMALMHKDIGLREFLQSIDKGLGRCSCGRISKNSTFTK